VRLLQEPDDVLFTCAVEHRRTEVHTALELFGQLQNLTVRQL
jgi:hypothetical protein